MATTRHTAYASSIATILSTELNTLANSTNSAASAEIDNSVSRDLYHDLTLTVNTTSTRSTGGSVSVYLIMALDDTNYDAVNETTAELVTVFTLDAATTSRQLTRRDIPVPPGKFKYFVRNNVGVSLNATGNLLEYRAHSVETV